MGNNVALGLVLLVAGCGAGSNGDGGGDGGPPGGGSGTFPPGGISFPWPVFDGTVPDTPEAAGGGKTVYVDGSHGSDAADGLTFATAKKTLTAALGAGINAGDTILIAGGIYRERPNFDGVKGAPGKPVTIGSYGRGTGAPILDGGEHSTAWTQVSGTVWKTSTAMLPKVTAAGAVLGIYVHSGENEFALKEVAHGQLTPYGNEPIPSGETQADVKDNTNKWFYDKSAKTLYADFGGTLGSGDPNTGDVSILYNSSDIGHEPLILLVNDSSYFSFVGLTIRAGSWHGVYSETKGHSFDHCDVKFNGGGGISFDTSQGDLTITDNKVINTRVWMNVLDNWPRFNNGNTGGGWPGGMSFYSQSNALFQGNVVYQNGGEGVVFYGTNQNGGTTHVSMNNHVLHNIVFDNWSVNLYLDNTQHNTVEQNFVFDHPREAGQTFDNLLTMSMGYSTDFGRRMTPVAISLGDEPGSADDGHAHLSDITVINNIFAGGKFGFVDYDDGTSAPMHGLKNCVIANNTWVMADQPFPDQTAYGWRHLNIDGIPDASTGSIVQNNLFVTIAADDHFIETGDPGAGTGIDNDYNFYSGPGQFSDVAHLQDFAAWKSAHPTWDQHSHAGDATLVDQAEFSQTLAQKFVYDWAKAVPQSGSPAFGAGTGQQFTTDFTGAQRGANDVGAVARH